MVLVVGLTGGIASGKSTVGRILAERCGFRVVDCDQLGHATYAVGTDTYRQLVEAFGDVRAADGSIDRKKLGGKVFGNAEAMKRLTDIVWPGIARLLQEELQKLAGERVVFVEAAVLFEAGWEKLCHKVWTVAVSQEEAVLRLAKRNNLSEEQAKARIASQMSNAERAAKADIVIENQGSLETLELQVLEQVAAMKSKL